MKIFIVSIAKLIGCLCLMLSLSACFIRPYKFGITQGNVITASKVAELQEGMSEEEVLYILGTPMLNDVFHLNRWDYIYYEKPTYGVEKRHHVAVYFENGHIAKITQDLLQESAA
ncbi:MAG: outer membrane protein assembly factor BamE [Proteobacteria bacterium]|nr:outer membrane protein assembly factor BamE [Pseudomonadota bacterium]